MSLDDETVLHEDSDDEDAVDFLEIELKDEDDSDTPEYVPPDCDPEDIGETILPIISQAEIHEPTYDCDLQKPSTSIRNETHTYKRKKKHDDDPVFNKKKQTTSEERESRVIQVNVETVAGKNGFLWNTRPVISTTGNIPNKNVVHAPSPTNLARNVTSPSSCFKLFFTPNIMEEILIHTNEEIISQRKNYSLFNDATLKDLTMIELEALIGLLILGAALKNNHLSTDILFDSSYSGERYKATMSKRRFAFLINCLRFDDKNTSEMRRETDKLAPISFIWNLLLKNCTNNYQPGSNLTIDEQLVGFRGKCPFKMYIPSKTNKYGMKIVTMCDSGTKYMVDARPYLGKDSIPNGMSTVDYFINELIETIKGSNRNVTINNWFVNIPLVLELQKEKGLTVVGTIKRNIREFPTGFIDQTFNERKVGSSVFLFHENLTAVSYKPKENKVVTLVSSKHLDASVNNELKPEVMNVYNETKNGVDCFDQMSRNMNCGRKTKRWPLNFFYNMMNIASINSYIVYAHNAFNMNSKPLSRLNYMIAVHEQLAEEFQRHRLQSTPYMGKQLKNSIQTVLKITEDVTTSGMEIAEKQVGPRKYCSFCDYKKKRMTKSYCLCGKSICGGHTVKKCPDCK